MEVNQAWRPSLLNGFAIDASELKFFDEVPSNLLKHTHRRINETSGDGAYEKRYGYHKRSLSETEMFRVKKWVGGTLSLRNYNA